jgi:hypothetical protein
MQAAEYIARLTLPWGVSLIGTFRRAPAGAGA